MMKNSRIGKTALIAAAVTLTASLSVGSALAYFTTYCTAEGSYKMSMGFPETEIHEHVESGKHITIENIGQYDCYVRVKAFAPEGVTLNYVPEEDSGWIGYGDDGYWEDDYWYYNSILRPGETTPELLIQYIFPEDKDQDPGNDTRPDEINIVVVHECTPVLYDEEGNPYADWNNAVILEEHTEPGTGTDTETTTEQEGE